MMNSTTKPLALIILDGWGYSESDSYNAIKAANTPTWDTFWSDYPHTLIEGSGDEVGLPAGQMGNSEVGHLNLGAGRVVYQDISRINMAIEHGSFFSNSVLLKTLQQAKTTERAVHVLGLLSPGGVHSHEQHLYALLKLAAEQKVSRIYIHAFLDGRDTPPRSALSSIKALEQHIAQLGVGHIASIIGRYYAMDRNKNWQRTEQAYQLITKGQAQHHATSAEQALQQAYARDESDEFVQATAITNDLGQSISINPGDSIIFMNFRADRARQLTHAFIDDHFQGFHRPNKLDLAHFVSLTEYAADLATEVAFPPIALSNVLGEYLAKLGLKQLRIAETEKYAHVTFFFNGGVETPFTGEDRILVPSPDVSTYDLKPEMSATELTDQLVAAIDSQNYDVIICNYANPDMVGHTGNFSAAVTAIETIDDCLARLHTALQNVGGAMLITADHGNAECMYDERSQQAHTAHTTARVPLLYVGEQTLRFKPEDGRLSDIAPTLLTLMGLDIPAEMTGHSLLEE